MIIHPNKFYQKLPAGFDGVFDWDFLLPAFAGTNIQPMDIDAIVERRGKFLIFESKEPDKDVPQGQIITLQQLIRLGRGKINVFILYGKTPLEIIAMDEWYWLNSNVSTNFRECDAQYVLERTSQWFEWANKT